jgi:peptidyl-prolyl cis-trans isomerase A (cyclophilin A)
MRLRLTIVGTMMLVAAATAGVLLAGQADKSKLLTPAALTEKAPASYIVNFDTSKGLVVVQVHRDWAPLGADRFYNLVKNGFFDEARFYRVVPNFMVQFGMNANPAVTTAWRPVTLADDPVTKSNQRGFITFANTGQPNSRGTNVFINFKDNSFLDKQRFAPFGEVTKGMDVVEKITAEYGEKPDQNSINSQGNAYLTKAFPKLDYVKSATIAK